MVAEEAAARKAAEEESAAIKAEEAEARKAAEMDAARKKMMEAAARKRAAEEAAARKEAEEAAARKASEATLARKAADEAAARKEAEEAAAMKAAEEEAAARRPQPESSASAEPAESSGWDEDWGGGSEASWGDGDDEDIEVRPAAPALVAQDPSARVDPKADARECGQEAPSSVDARGEGAGAAGDEAAGDEAAGAKEADGGAASWGGGWGWGSSIAQSVAAAATGLVAESAGGLADLASDVSRVAGAVGSAAGKRGLKLADEAAVGLSALAQDGGAIAKSVAGTIAAPAVEGGQPPSGPEAGGERGGEWGDESRDESREAQSCDLPLGGEGEPLHSADEAAPAAAEASGVAASPPVPATPPAASAREAEGSADRGEASGRRAAGRVVASGGRVLAGLMAESAGGLAELASDVSRVAGAVGSAAGKRGLKLADEAAVGLSALAQDGGAIAKSVAGSVSQNEAVGGLVRDVGGLANDAVHVASVVGGMVASDALGAVDSVSSDAKVSGGLRAASELAARELSTLSRSGAEGAVDAVDVLVSGLKDNVTMMDAVGRSTVESVRSAVGSAFREAEEEACVGDEPSAPAEAASAVASAPAARPFEAWWDVYGGALRLTDLEGLRDACALRVETKLGRLSGRQRAELRSELALVEALVADGDDGDSDGEGGGGGAAEGGGGCATGTAPPTDRLASRAEADMGAVRDATLSAVADIVSECVRTLREAGEASDAAGRLGPAARLESARAGVGAVQAHASHCLAHACAACLRCVGEYASTCKLMTDSPPESMPGARLEGEPWLHGLDWPFVSELERAKWKGHNLRDASSRLPPLVDAAAKEMLAAARGIEAAVGSDVGDGDEEPQCAAARAALRQQLKALKTSLFLDSSAAVAMVQEAGQLCAPILSYVALGDC